MNNPKARWGAWFTSDPTHDEVYLAEQLLEDSDTMRRGELFINEPLEEIYYVDSAGVVHIAGSTQRVAFSRINFAGIREFDSDVEAAAANPPVAVGGLYHTNGVLKVRLV